ncbi:MAG: rod shape-determining protein MreC [Candidatus Moranbacteria bacterium]|nr:rod shape-determining protein MreC [Candidatus Moranbacteria bacterium]
MRVRNFPQSRLFRATVAIIVSFMVSVWGPQPIGGFFRGAFHTVFLPFERGFSAVGFQVSDLREFLVSIGKLKSENERLHDENLRLVAENASLASLRSENDELRKFTGLEVNNKPERIPGEVVAFGQERGFVVIDRGNRQGVMPGMPVLSASGALVGTVSETYPGSSTIMLLANSDSAVGGITAEQGTKGVIRGDRGLGIAFSMVLRADALAAGDRVVTTGSAEGMPAGLFVGTVSSVQDTADRLFREATIVPPEEIGKVHFLFVVKGKGGV